MAASWGYGRADGPDTWSHKFPAACGRRQSPVDIDSVRVEYSRALQTTPLRINYLPEKGLKICNTGTSIKAGCSQNSTLTGGPLGRHVYQLAQFHFHWGDQDNCGSEHTLDGRHYSAELHFVHWNSTAYTSFEEAVNKSDGLAVLCVFIKTGGAAHRDFEKMSRVLHRVTHKGTSCSLIDVLDPASLLPGNTKRYWTYPGSLTTPPCYESVQFIVFEQTVSFSQEQMKALRSLRTGGKGSSVMAGNFRPTCPLGNRIVLASFAYALRERNHKQQPM